MIHHCVRTVCPLWRTTCVIRLWGHKPAGWLIWPTAHYRWVFIVRVVICILVWCLCSQSWSSVGFTPLLSGCWYQCSTLGSIIQCPECIVVKGDGADSVQPKSHVVQLLSSNSRQGTVETIMWYIMIMFLCDNHHFVFHPSDLGECSVVNLPYITVSQFIHIRQVWWCWNQWKTLFSVLELVLLQIYIYFSDYISIVLGVPVGVTLVFLCHLWVEVYAPGEDIVWLSHF